MSARLTTRRRLMLAAGATATVALLAAGCTSNTPQDTSTGGRGTITGTVLGVLIFTTLQNVFTQNNLSSSAQSVAKGIIIVVAVLLQQRLAARSNSGSP